MRIEKKEEPKKKCPFITLKQSGEVGMDIYTSSRSPSCYEEECMAWDKIKKSCILITKANTGSTTLINKELL